MATNQNTQQNQSSGGSNGDGNGKESFQISAPSISLPKGGGAIRGMGEKFAANPVTGTGSMTVPIATSPGRSGFGPQLSLTYDSGAGNGPFGFGWNHSLPSITRKTDKGLPKYQDLDESDVFILSGAEDLVPTLVKDAQNRWVNEPVPDRTINTNQVYRIQHYRPRIEGLFARIERWSNTKNADDVFWRSISKDNITTWYGKDENSRISDPNDATHIFSWLICETYDDKGNVIVYEYKSEDSERIFEDQHGKFVARAHERNRTDDTRKANRYLKRIYYGNREPYLPEIEEDKPWPSPPKPGMSGDKPNWFFEVVFDYDDGHCPKETTDGEGRVLANVLYSPPDAEKWKARVDPFSSYRAGFEVRTYRFCQRVLMFHHFPDRTELGVPDYLVRSTEFTYSYEEKPDDARNPIYSFLNSVKQSGYVRQTDDTYLKKSLPPVEFEYTKPEVQAEVHDVDPQSLENLPYGLDGSNYQWVDLDGEGLSGILTEQGGVWFYKRNLSPLPIKTNGKEEVTAHFAPLELIAKKPSLAAISAGGQQFLDVAGDGKLDLVALSGPTPGFFERTQDENWEPFKSFRFLPNVEWNNPNLKFVDLTGDGHADILITEDDVFWWHPSLAEDGFGPAERVPQNWDEEKGPRLVFADLEHSIYLGDLSGDGLSDLVRIRNGEVCYWPNLGYGRFGAKVTMDNSPWFENPDQFEPRRIQLADIDGSGTTDIIYIGRTGVDLYFNQSGNGWSQPQRLKSYPGTDNLSSVTAMDLLGNGTACLVWSSPLPGNARRPMRYIDLMGGTKPHLMIKIRNNLGAKTEVQYAPSTKFYVQDKFAGKPWITKIPFPVHVVEKTIITDDWRKTEFSTSYNYHHGYYDGIEREFRGFGRVEQVDVEDYGPFQIRNKNNPYVTDDDKLYQPPVKTATWFHTGAFLDRERILSHFEDEYFPAWYEALDPTKKNVLGKFQENQLPEPDLDAQGLSAEEWREALRACKGMTLRQEIYELDVEALEKNKEHRPVKLFSTGYHNCHIQRLQPKEQNRHAVFLVTESEAITYHYELALPASSSDLTPDPRISHTLNLLFDDYGRALQTVAIAYPRQVAYSDPTNTFSSEQRALIQDVQGERHLAYSETHFTDELPYDRDKHRLPAPCEMLTYELTGSDATHGFTPGNGLYFSRDDLRAFRLSDSLPEQGSKPVAKLEYHEQPLDETAQKRIVEWVRMLYFNDDLSGPNPFSQYAWLGLPYETYKVALTGNLLDGVFGGKLTADVITILNTSTRSGYIPGTMLDAALTNQYWMRSGIAGFAIDARDHFYLPERYTDPFSNTTELEYDVRGLFIKRSTDARGNITAIADDEQGEPRFDYRVLAPLEVVDINGNHSEVYFDILGLVIALAIKGKKVGGHWQGDNLDDFIAAPVIVHANPPAAAVVNFCTSSLADRVQARTWLGNASARFVYHFGERIDANGKPVWNDRMAGACGIVREQHVGQLASGEVSPLQIALQCSDGGGNVLMKKSQAESDPATGHEQWIVNGLTVLNNKGKPVKQYEPVFSDRFGCEMPQANGVTPIMYYDAPGRLIRTELPDGSFSYVEFSPWFIRTFDQNDTVTESQWYRERLTTTERGSGATQGTADEEQRAAQASPEDKRAARLAAHHANTPAETAFDSLGREVIAVAHNRTPDANGVWQDEKYFTFTKLDTEGKPLWIRNAHSNLVVQYITPSKPTRWADSSNENIPTGAVPCYDIAGNLLFQHSMDAGDRWMLMDAAGKPMVAWDLNDKGPGSAVQARMFHTEYDELHRPTKQWLRIDTATAALVEAFDYCDTDQPTGAANLNDAKQRNLIGQAVRHWDPSGLSTVERIDLSGNPAHVTRTLIKTGFDGDSGILNWDVVDRHGLLESETFHQITEYDALGRMTTLYNWHRDITFRDEGTQATPGQTNRVAVYVPTYNAGGVLQSEWLNVRASKSTDANNRITFIADTTRRQQAIKSITYNAKGQKLSLALGNGTITRYTYDDQTFRLTHLYTRRDARFPTDCDGDPDVTRPARPCGMQNLHYTYDPVGNITHIQDDAQQSVYFSNSLVEPSNDYTYDALYHLIEATGRENAAAVAPPRNREGPWPTSDFPSADALRNYRQRYRYDAVGNFVEMVHLPSSGSGWTRHYTTKADSNRLDQTWYGSNTIEAITYRHDAHGNMFNLNRTETPPPLDPEERWGLDIRWDWRDMILGFDLGGGGLARYHYGIDKQRTRKHITRNTLGGATFTEDRMYLNGYELYRRRNAMGTVVEEVESHHLFEGEQRVVLVDDVIRAGGTSNPRPDGLSVKGQTLFRYQYGNHLGSVCLELDHQAEIVSYEEYHPYGTTAYRLMNSAIEAPAKRYRYTAMERDEESGLNYHRARCYAPWLARWSSVDPIGIRGGLNLYDALNGNPVRHTDRDGHAPRMNPRQFQEATRAELAQSSTKVVNEKGLNQKGRVFEGGPDSVRIRGSHNAHTHPDDPGGKKYPLPSTGGAGKEGDINNSFIKTGQKEALILRPNGVTYFRDISGVRYVSVSNYSGKGLPEFFVVRGTSGSGYTLESITPEALKVEIDAAILTSRTKTVEIPAAEPAIKPNAPSKPVPEVAPVKVKPAAPEPPPVTPVRPGSPPPRGSSPGGALLMLTFIPGLPGAAYDFVAGGLRLDMEARARHPGVFTMDPDDYAALEKARADSLGQDLAYYLSAKEKISYQEAMKIVNSPPTTGDETPQLRAVDPQSQSMSLDEIRARAAFTRYSSD